MITLNSNELYELHCKVLQAIKQIDQNSITENEIIMLFSYLVTIKDYKAFGFIYAQLDKIFIDVVTIKDTVLEIFQDINKRKVKSTSFVCDLIWKGLMSKEEIMQYRNYDPCAQNAILQTILIKAPHIIIENYDKFCMDALPETIIKYIEKDIPNKPVLNMIKFKYLIPKVFIKLGIIPSKDEIDYMLKYNASYYNEILNINSHTLDNVSLRCLLSGYYLCEGDNIEYIDRKHGVYPELCKLLHIEDTFIRRLRNTNFIDNALSRIIKFVVDSKAIDFIINNNDCTMLKKLMIYQCDIKPHHIDYLIRSSLNLCDTLLKHAMKYNLELNVEVFNKFLNYGYNRRKSNDLCNIEFYRLAQSILDFRIIPNEISFNITIKEYDKRMLFILIDNNFNLQQTHINELNKRCIDISSQLDEYNYFKIFMADIEFDHNTLSLYPAEMRNQIVLRELFRAREYKKALAHMKQYKLRPDRYCSEFLYKLKGSKPKDQIMEEYKCPATSYRYQYKGFYVKKEHLASVTIDCAFMSTIY